MSLLIYQRGLANLLGNYFKTRYWEIFIMSTKKSEDKKIFQEFYKSAPQLFNDIIRAQRSEGLAFRGVSRSIENKPKIQRVFDNKFKLTVDCSENEFQMLNDFYRLGRPYFTVNYDVLDYVACAQHYGVPTRLIDWTRDPFVALFFAVYNNASPEDDIYTIYYANLSEHTVIDRIYNAATWFEVESGSEFILKYKSFIEVINDENKFRECGLERRKNVEDLGIIDNCNYNENSLLFFNPPMSNDRLIAQQGLFSIPPSLKNNHAADDIKKKTDYFKLIFTPGFRDDMIIFLNNMNYTPTRLFPELESIGNYIKRKYVK